MRKRYFSKGKRYFVTEVKKTLIKPTAQKVIISN